MVVLLAMPFPAGGQTREEDRELFDEGQYFLNRKDYREAAFYFKRIADKHQDNANFSFKLGECYMNMPGSESLAIPYFEKAILQTVSRKQFREKDFAETRAPLHALFYLGNVYRMKNRLDDALRVYNVFISSPFYYGNYNENIVDNEIRSCERAKIIQDNPVSVVEQVLDTMINTNASELYPVITRDESTLVFLRKLKFYDAIFLTTRKGDTWSQPENLNPIIGSDGEYYPACLSADGNELFLVKTGGDSDIWLSVRQAAGWSKAMKLKGNINSRADETSAWISADGKKLYFTSSRKRGQGGKDIYYVRRDQDGEWGRAHNLGKEVNTAFDEENPCLINDSTLFFSSKGHYSMGGYDIFSTSYRGNTWSEPVNLGFPVNDTGDNLGFVAIRNGKAGYYARMNLRDPLREADVYRVDFK